MASFLVFLITLAMITLSTNNVFAQQVEYPPSLPINEPYVCMQGIELCPSMTNTADKYDIGTVTFEHHVFSTIPDSVSVTVVEPEINNLSSEKNSIKVDVWSGAEPSGEQITLLETGIDSGIFKGDVLLSRVSTSKHDGILSVRSDDVLTVVYLDSTLLPSAPPNTWIGVFDKAVIGNEILNSGIPYVKNIPSPHMQMKMGVIPYLSQCRYGLDLVLKRDTGSAACIKPESLERLLVRGWATYLPTIILKESKSADSHVSSANTISQTSGLKVDVTGEQQVRRGTTHNIYVTVTRNGVPIPDSLVIITIEDYGENVIKRFKGHTDTNGGFVFSWEIPKSFDDLKTLLAYVDVTDNLSSKTILFKFQVYCLPGEPGCKAERR